MLSSLVRGASEVITDSATTVAPGRAEASERALAALWRNAHTLPDGLVAQDGRRFDVVYPGRPNSRAGPDFRDAVIATERGDLVTGDVEIHLGAPDWYNHGHDADPNYNGVILHVVLWPKGQAASSQHSGLTAPVASVAAVAPALERSEALPPGFALEALTAAGGRGLGDVLDAAGDERFLARSRGFALELARSDPDQVLYSALFEALGYATNRKPFRELARLVPVALLFRLRPEPPATRLLAVKAMLLGAAGFLSHAAIPREETRQMQWMLRRLPRTGRVPPHRWRLFRVRPANHPVSRIAGAAHLVDSHMDTGLVAGLASGVEHGDARSLTGRLTARPFIGKGRAGDLAVNVVLPFLHCYAGVAASPALRTRCAELYQTFPSLDDNEITREMKRLLGIGPSSKQAKGARRQQGLIHLYKRVVGDTRVRATRPAKVVATGG